MKLSIDDLRTMILQEATPGGLGSLPSSNRLVALRLVEQIGTAVADAAAFALIEEVKDNGGPDLSGSRESATLQHEVAKQVRQLIRRHFYRAPEVD